MNHTPHLLTLMLLVAALLMACTPTSRPMSDDDAQRVREMTRWQLEHYPQSRLIDLYKTCFQDYMGPEHAVTSKTLASNNLNEELSGLDMDSLATTLYEPCGVDSQYYRVNLRAVAQGNISAHALLDAFVASAQRQHPTVEQWKQRWQQIQQVISGMQLSLPHYQQDSTAIAAMLDVGDCALSHSDEYKSAYYPHYRIVARDILESELQPALDKR